MPQPTWQHTRQKVSFISGPTEHYDSGTPSTFAMQQQLRPPFCVQTGCKRSAVKLRVCLPFPHLLLHSLFPSTTGTQAKISRNYNRSQVDGHYLNRLFISLSTYMFLTRITAMQRSLLYSVFLLPFSNSWQFHRRQPATTGVFRDECHAQGNDKSYTVRCKGQ
jgi:hypothetical protein